MIEPKMEDVGRRVEHRPAPDIVPREGELISYSNRHVFVRFDGSNYNQACRREHLEWVK